MSVWQIVMTIIATIYALMFLYVLVSSIRDWGQTDAVRSVVRYCPPGSRCQLCADAREADERRPQGSEAPTSIGQPGG